MNSETASSIPFFLGRQPILDRKGDTFAYELLFRSGTTNAAEFDNPHEATLHVIARAFSEMGVQSVLGEHLGFLNCDADMLVSEMTDVLPPEFIVLELLESIEFTPALVERCRDMHGRGFRFALDDITALEPEHRDILPYVDYVKVDVLGMPNDSLTKLARQLKPLGLRLLAEKVETISQAEFCIGQGFECFQGYYFARPQVLEGRMVQHSNPHLLRLLQLTFTDGDLGEMGGVFKQDPKLSYNLLRLVNSVGIGARSRISSIGQAIMLLGRQQLKNWLSLLAFAHKGNGRFPNPLVLLAASRGKMLERLAALEGGSRENQEQAYVAGMMSLMETALDIPLDRICVELQLGDVIGAALLQRQGRLGCHLDLVEATERWDANLIITLLERLALSMDQLAAVQIEAMNWANTIGKEE